MILIENTLNISTNLQEVVTTPELVVSSQAISVVLSAVIGIIVLGPVANASLLMGLMLLHGRGHMSVASVQMLAQQASVDLILNVLSIAYA